MAYSEKVIDHYENPRNVGKFSKEDIDAGLIGTGLVGAPAWYVLVNSIPSSSSNHF